MEISKRRIKNEHITNILIIPLRVFCLTIYCKNIAFIEVFMLIITYIYPIFFMIIIIIMYTHCISLT